MGQTSSSLPARRPAITKDEGTPLPSASGNALKSADPFHRSPISPQILPTSLPPPTLPRVNSRPSLSSLRKPSLSSRLDDNNLPKPPTLSARVVRKLSRSRKGGISTGPTLAAPAIPFDPIHHSYSPEELLDTLGPSSYGRYPPLINNKLSTSLDSSTLSGPSTSLVTPAASRRNLTSPTPGQPTTPRHQIRPYPSHHHRRGSSTSSARSGGAGKAVGHSPKTRTRAEREWRARVAAISAGSKGRGTGVQEAITGGQRRSTAGDSPVYKGPVPPRRRGGPQASISAVPAPPVFQVSPGIPTPHLLPHLLLPRDTTSPGNRSITSARSFETLGDHTHSRRPTSLVIGSPGHVRYRSIPLPADRLSSSPLSHHRAHSRKGSIPQSIGSFYADPAIGSGTRPNSLAASTLLSPLKAVVAVEAEEDEEDEGIVMGMGAGEMARARLSKEVERGRKSIDDGLMFDMAMASPKPDTRPLPTVLSTLPSRPHTPTLPLSSTVPTASRTPTRSDEASRRHSVQHTPPPTIAFGQGPETPRSRARKERILSLPSIDTSPQRTPTRKIAPHFAFPPSTTGAVVASSPTALADTSMHTDATSPSLPSLLSYTLSTPTPTRQSSGTGPAVTTPCTPYSPMTAYILSAPSIDLTFPTQQSVPASPQGWMKGYSSGGGRVSRNAGEWTREGEGQLHPFAKFLDAPSPPRAKGGKLASAENDARRGTERGLSQLNEAKISTRQQANSSKPNPRSTAYSKALAHPTRPVQPLRPKTPNGLPTARDAVLGSVEKQERTRGKVEFDLCPGMGIGGGVRPPKRGMDKSDLERWLAGTTSS